MRMVAELGKYGEILGANEAKAVKMLRHREPVAVNRSALASSSMS